MEFDMHSLTNRRTIVAMLLTVCAYCPALASPAAIPPRASVAVILAPQLKRGDLVRLRSGGPMMTVSAVKSDQIECFWTDENGQPNDASFPADVLQLF
jgi:uncharacterized protein YodC (DUF2158 family)